MQKCGFENMLYKPHAPSGMRVEYVRSLNCNYERILLEEKPEEKRYQYCIVSRGGIKGLLSCSLRYMDGRAFLYYDISSMQNVAQLYAKNCVTRRWMKDFLWSMRQIKQELERFLLDSKNIIWYPEQIFQDLENNVFYFLYLPYYEGETGFLRLLEFLVEHVDYEDEALVNLVYRMYEQLEQNGEVYLQTQIFEDAKCLEETKLQDGIAEGKTEEVLQEETGRLGQEDAGELQDSMNKEREGKEREAKEGEAKEEAEKRGIFSIFESRKKRGREQRDEYKYAMQSAMEGYAVAEETDYEEEPLGRTMFVEEKVVREQGKHRLLSAEGNLLAMLDKPSLSIGKKKGEVDVVLKDLSVSRIHARILVENREAYLEDLNSTNGTFKNGLRLQPYEKRRLEEGDEIKCGTVELLFR